VASILTTRGIAPSDVIALGPEGIDVVEEQPLVTIGRYFNPVEAHGHRMALEEANLRAWVTDESGGAMFGVGVGTRLQVRVEDEAAARAVLEGAAVPASTPPPELAEAACPKCGSPGVEQEAAQPGHASRYECSSCRHSWSE
jgi:hypothetical protein